MAERIITSGAAEICCEAFGNPGDPAILLIMGAGGSMLKWDEALIDMLVADGRYAIRYDNRDTGRSTTCPPGEPDYTLTDMAADAIAVLDAYQVDKAHLMGRSMGGMITQNVVLDYPGRVTTATLIYTTPSNSIAGGFGDDLPGMTQDLIEANVQAARTDVDEEERVRLQLRSMEVLQGTRYPLDVPKTLALIEREKARARNYASSANHSLAIRNSANWRHRLGEMETPTLIVHGTEDPIFQVAHAKALAAEIAGAEVLWVEGLGHALPEGAWSDVVPRLLAHTAG